MRHPPPSEPAADKVGALIDNLRSGDARERARAEDEIRALHQELEQRVAQRTQELARSNFELETSLRRLGETQEQLIHAGKMAAVGTLVAGLSHELNNPLGIIVGYVQGLLRRMSPGTNGRESLVAVERQALRCAHLVRSLLDFSRSKPAIPEDTSVGPLIERVMELAAGQARRRRVELRFVERPPIPLATVYAQEIESALMNLVGNAIDATSADGSVTVTVAASPHDQTDGIEISVTDTGTGITRAVLPRIFDPFFTTKPVGEGTGIGLSLTRQIVEGHDGRIDVRTAEGVGTTMRMWLPLVMKPVLPIESESSTTGGAAGRITRTPAPTNAVRGAQ
jgi:signal transduction histidine kinase